MNMRLVKEICRVVMALKRRHAFTSLVVTGGLQIQISFWNGREIVTGALEEAKLYLRALDENDRRDIEWAARRLGRIAA